MSKRQRAQKAAKEAPLLPNFSRRQTDRCPPSLLNFITLLSLFLPLTPQNRAKNRANQTLLLFLYAQLGRRRTPLSRKRAVWRRPWLGAAAGIGGAKRSGQHWIGADPVVVELPCSWRRRRRHAAAAAAAARRWLWRARWRVEVSRGGVEERGRGTERERERERKQKAKRDRRPRRHRRLRFVKDTSSLFLFR